MFKRYWMILLLCSLGVSWTSVAQSCTDFTTANEYGLRGDTAFDSRLFEDAVLDYSCAIQLDPTDTSYYNSRGNAYYWLERDAEARADYVKVLELDPEASYAHNNLANLYYKIGDYEQALEGYTRALELGENDSQAHVTYDNRGGLYFQTGDYEKAQADISKALELVPNYESAHLTQATLYSLENRSQEAAEAYLEWVNLTSIRVESPPYVVNRSYQTRLQTGDSQQIYLTLQAGDVLSVSANVATNNERVDPLLIIAEDGLKPLIADDDSGVNSDAVINDFVVPTSGSYVVILANSGGYYYSGSDGLVDLSIKLTRGGEQVATELVVIPTAVTTTDNATPEPTPELVETELDTASFASYRLFTNVTAEVSTTEGDRLNLRGGPGLRFDILTKLEDGTLVTLVDGPHKEDGLLWWNVRAGDGTIGWAVERVDTDQTLVIALVVGEDAIVSGDGERLNARDSAGGERIFQIEDGTRLTLLEVPQFANGFRWWKVRTPDGEEGWVVDQIEGVRTLVPAKELE